jgi:photosystem II stability/assembly factor-like uncharacterized protein
VSEAVGLLAWPGRLYLVAGGCQVFASRDGGRRLDRHGEIGGQPAALVAEGLSELYVAQHDGTIKRSTDGGANWAVRFDALTLAVSSWRSSPRRASSCVLP